MEAVGSLQVQHAVKGPNAAQQNSGAGSTSKAVEDARKEAKEAPKKELAAAPRHGNPEGEDTAPTRGHGLGQRVDIKV